MIDNKNERNKFRMGIQNLLDFDFVNTVIFIQSSPINNAIILDLFLFRFILAILFESLNSFHSLYFTGSFGPQSGLDLKIYDKKREIKIFYFSNSINFFHSLFFLYLHPNKIFLPPVLICWWTSRWEVGSLLIPKASNQTLKRNITFFLKKKTII